MTDTVNSAESCECAIRDAVLSPSVDIFFMGLLLQGKYLNVILKVSNVTNLKVE